jgi:PmbA protein
MSNTNVHDMAAQLLDAARKAGAGEADVLAVEADGVSVKTRNGKTDEVERSETQDYGLRVFVNKASAVVSGAIRSSADAATMAERAVAMAKIAPPDPSLGLLDPTPGRIGGEELELELDDGVMKQADELALLAAEAEDAAASVTGVSKTDSASAHSGRRRIIVLNSRGFDASYGRSGHSISATAIAGEGTAMEREYDYSYKVHFADLKPAGEIGRRAGELAVRALGPRKIKSQKCPILFEARVASTFASLLASAANGASVARGTSFLKDALETQVFAPGIRIVDDPRQVRGTASKPFDAEGQLTGRLALVDDGFLQTWLLDGRTAAKLGLHTNARAARSTGGQPSPSSTNLWLEAGSKSADELMREAGSGVLITSMFSSGVNMVTGDFSRGASGLWFENGEIAYPVSEITIAGNLKDMFAHLTPASDLEFRGSVNAPTCLVEGMTIAGA